MLALTFIGNVVVYELTPIDLFMGFIFKWDIFRQPAGFSTSALPRPAERDHHGAHDEDHDP